MGWPLLSVGGLNAPEGTLATFVDVIPLYASVLELVVPADRFPFNPYGYWVALGYVLMAVGHYVNLYIFAMTALVFTADVARLGPSLGWRRALGGFLLPIAPIGLSLPVTMLPISHVSGEPEPGFGFYSMNLLAPFTAQHEHCVHRARSATVRRRPPRDRRLRPQADLYVFVHGEAAARAPAEQFPPDARLQCRELDIAVACRWVGGAARP